jgi:hypothetical protein
MRSGQWRRLQDEVAQAWNVALKDVRVYYLTPPMIMFGLMMPFFMFFSFSVRREMAAAQGIARLLALTTFFTASSAGPVIIPLERRMGTYDRLLVAPMSLSSADNFWPADLAGCLNQMLENESGVLDSVFGERVKDESQPSFRDEEHG